MPSTLAPLSRAPTEFVPANRPSPNRSSSEQPTYQGRTDRTASARASSNIPVASRAPRGRPQTDRRPTGSRPRNGYSTVHDISDPEHLPSDGPSTYRPEPYRDEARPPPRQYIRDGVPMKRNAAQGPPGGRPPPTRHRPWTTATYLGLSSFVLPVFSIAHLYFNHNITWPAYWTIGVSIVTFLQFGYDKMQARNQLWRVKKFDLQMSALLGGWPGALLGMHYFQHKTSKPAFYGLTAAIVLLWEGIWTSILFSQYGPSFSWARILKPFELGKVAEPLFGHSPPPPPRPWWEKSLGENLFDRQGA